MSGYIDDGHRIHLPEDVMSYSKQIFDAGFQLEAIILSHEYLELRLNKIFQRSNEPGRQISHRQFKQLIELLLERNLLMDAEYATLNEFNRLRNVNSNQILDSSISLRGAKKGEMYKAISLANDCDQIISRLDAKLTKELAGQKRKARR